MRVAAVALRGTFRPLLILSGCGRRRRLLSGLQPSADEFQQLVHQQDRAGPHQNGLPIVFRERNLGSGDIRTDAHTRQERGIVGAERRMEHERKSINKATGVS